MGVVVGGGGGGGCYLFFKNRSKDVDECFKAHHLVFI